MAFARERCLPTDICLGPTDGEVGGGTDATAIRTPKSWPGILGRHGAGRRQRQDREQGKNESEWGIAVAVQHRTQLRAKRSKFKLGRSSSFLVSPLSCYAGNRLLSLLDLSLSHRPWNLYHAAGVIDHFLFFRVELIEQAFRPEVEGTARLLAG